MITKKAPCTSGIFMYGQPKYLWLSHVATILWMTSIHSMMIITIFLDFSQTIYIYIYIKDKKIKGGGGALSNKHWTLLNEEANGRKRRWGFCQPCTKYLSWNEGRPWSIVAGLFCFFKTRSHRLMMMAVSLGVHSMVFTIYIYIYIERGVNHWLLTTSMRPKNERLHVS